MLRILPASHTDLFQSSRGFLKTAQDPKPLLIIAQSRVILCKLCSVYFFVELCVGVGVCWGGGIQDTRGMVSLSLGPPLGIFGMLEVNESDWLLGVFLLLLRFAPSQSFTSLYHRVQPARSAA